MSRKAKNKITCTISFKKYPSKNMWWKWFGFGHLEVKWDMFSEYLGFKNIIKASGND